MLASVWQATANRYDVDASGLVSPIDVAHVIQEINQSGARNLPATLPSNFSGIYCDVNGDGVLSPIDVYQVIDIINQYPAAPTINAELSIESDRNLDEVVLSNQVLFNLVGPANAVAKIEFLDGGVIASSMEHALGTTGRVSVSVDLPSAVNHMRFSVSDPRGRTASTERLVRVGDVIVQWNAAMLEVIRETTNVLSTGVLQKPPPPLVARNLAMMHGAMFDAMNSIEQDYTGYAYRAAANSSASSIAAASTAAYRVAQALFPDQAQRHIWDQTYAEVLATLPADNSTHLGIIVGENAAAAMLALRSSDGASSSSNYEPTDEIGRWRPTPPSFSEATLPQWPNVMPFGLTSGDQFRPAAPPNLDSTAYATAVDEVMRLGSVNSSERTADQTKIAKFWAGGGGTATPPGQWNIIATDVSLARGSTAYENARLFALLNYALADAGITSWDAKYAYDLWRPIDAIRLADQDGNAATTQDSNWTPLLTTPSFPAYTSGHSTFSGAAAQVLTIVLGNNIEFTTWADPGMTGAWPPSPDVSDLPYRSFTSFAQAAQEAGMSRIYGGIHFNFDNTAGLTSGTNVGQFVVDRLLNLRT